MGYSLRHLCCPNIHEFQCQFLCQQHYPVRETLQHLRAGRTCWPDGVSNCLCIWLRVLGTLQRRVWSMANNAAQLVIRQYLADPLRSGSQLWHYCYLPHSWGSIIRRWFCNTRHGSRHVGARGPTICCGLHCAIFRGRLGNCPSRWGLCGNLPGLALEFLDSAYPWRFCADIALLHSRDQMQHPYHKRGQAKTEKRRYGVEW